MHAAIDWAKVGELLWVAPLAGLAVSLWFSLLIFASARVNDARRAHAGGAAAGFTALAVLAGIAFLAVVVYGVEIITTK